MAKGVKKIAYSENFNEALRNTLMLIKGVKKITLYSNTYSMLGIPADEFSYFRISEWFPETTAEDKSKPITWLEQNFKRDKVLKNSKLISSGLYGLKILKKYAGITPIYLEASLLGQPDKKYDTGIYVFGYCSSKITESIWSTNKYGKDVRGSHQFSYGNTVWLALQTEGINGYTKVKIEVYRAKKTGEVSSEDQQIDHIFAKVEKGEINIGISTTKWWRMNPLPRAVENYYIKVVDPQNKKSYISHGNTKTIARFLVMKGEDPQPSPYSLPTNTTTAKIGLSGEIFTQVESCRFEEIEIIEPKTAPISIYNKETQLPIKNNSPKYGAKSQVFFFKDSTSYSLEHEGELLAVLQYVMENRLSIKIAGYASTDGDEKHNFDLAKRRALVLQDFFLSSGIDAKTISISYNIDRLSSAVIARRADITFPFTGHSAQALKYETIAPSSEDKKLNIKVKGYKTHTCFIDDTVQKASHKPKIIWSTYNFVNSVEGDSLILPVKSKLSNWNIAPIFQYLWPLSSSCYRYSEIHIHSCRYYSDISKPTIALYVYPDIKWDISIFVKLSNVLSIDWQNKHNEEELKDLRKQSSSLAAEDRWKRKDATFGVKFKADWDKTPQDKYNKTVEINIEQQSTTKKLFKLFSSIGAICDGITSATKGLIRTIGFKNSPVTFSITGPDISFGVEWYLERAEKKISGKQQKLPEIGTHIKGYIKASPLIAMNITIDLLGTAIVGTAAFFSGGTMAVPTAKVYGKIKNAIKKGKKIGNEKFGASLSGDIFIDLILSGTISTSLDFNFNTLGDNSTTKVQLEGKNVVKAEIKAGSYVKGEVVLLKVSAETYIGLEASGSASITYGHTLTYKNGLSYRPMLSFDGIKVKYIIYAKTGISIKKEKITNPIEDEKVKEQARYKNDTIIDQGEAILVPKFDVIKELEEFFDIDATIQLTKNETE